MTRPDGERPRRTPSQRLPVNPRRNKVAPENRKRVATACNSCNIRRVRCSGEHPCRQCSASGRECVYPVPVEKVSVSRAEWEELKTKTRLYERVLQDTVPDSAQRLELLRRTVSASSVSPGSSPSASVPSPGAFPLVVTALGGDQSASYIPPQPHATSQQAPGQSQQGLNEYNQTSQPVLQPKPDSQNDEVQAATQGRLLSDPDGQSRFLGETSGATFLDNLKEFMSTILPLAYDDNHTVVDGSKFLRSIGSYQTYDSRPLHDRNVDPLWLPTVPDIEAMLAELRFFIQDGNGSWPSGGVYWWGKFLSLPGISAIPWRDDPSMFDVQKCRDLAQYNAAFAVMTQATTSGMLPAVPEPGLSETYYARAHCLIGNPMDITRHTLSDVSTLALMGFYLIEMNRRDTAYMCIANAMHISVMHGAHRGWLEEPGKRVFWTLYILDRWLSCLMGRPPTFKDDAIQISMPVEEPGMPPAIGLTAHIELARISSHIVCNTYKVSPSLPSLGPLGDLERTLGMLENWLSALPPILQLFEPALSDDPAVCLLHMNYNQLVIITIRPIFFAAVKKTFAERLVARQSSLESHPQLSYIRRCVAAADANIRLARHILALNHPRKLLQSSLHFIFNAAICLMLQELVYMHDIVPRDRTLDSDLDFVIARFDEEARIGSNYGQDCADVLRDLRILVYRLRLSINPSQETIEAQPLIALTAEISAETVPVLGIKPSWVQDTLPGPLPSQQAHVGQGHVLYSVMQAWIDEDWSVDTSFMN